MGCRMTKELEAAILKAEQEANELHRRLKKVAELALSEEGSVYQIGVVSGLMYGVQQFLKDAKEPAI